MIALIVLAIVIGIILWYALHGRDWLKSKPWAQGFFEAIEPIEIFVYKKSETILVARSLQVLGAILTILTWFGSIDITPIMPLVPEKYHAYVYAAYSLLPLALNGLGAIVERLRNKTTKPIELVEVPDKVVAETPKIAEAMAVAEDAKTEAVAEVAAQQAA